MSESIFNARLYYLWDGIRRMMYSGSPLGSVYDSDPEFIVVSVVLCMGVLLLIMRSFYYLLRRL